METVRLILNQPDDYNRIVHGGVPQSSPITIASKSGGTDGGKSVVVISFLAHINGEEIAVQATTTLALLLTAARALQAAHGE